MYFTPILRMWHLPCRSRHEVTYKNTHMHTRTHAQTHTDRGRKHILGGERSDEKDGGCEGTHSKDTVAAKLSM